VTSLKEEGALDYWLF